VTRRRLRAVAACCAIVLVAGCNSTPAATPPAPPPKGPWTGPVSDVRVVWSAEPGVDLLTGPAVVVRAWQESVIGNGDGGSDDFLYPGFAHAVAPDVPWPGVPPSVHYPEAHQPNPYPIVGTDRYHILRIEPSGTNVVAVYCNWFYGRAEDLGGGKYGWHIPNPPSADPVATLWLALTPPPDGSTPLPPQKGPAPAPVDDVFGGWKVVQKAAAAGFDHGPPPEWPTMVDDANACAAKAPDPLERRLFLSTGIHPRSDFPTLPAFPGWPAGSAQ